jgi:hypothetical protein
MSKVTLKAGQFGWDYILVSNESPCCTKCNRTIPSNRYKKCPDCGCRKLKSADILIQSDWDYPGVASIFGWVACECGTTDGTISCAHKTASEMILDAQEFLDHNIGRTTEDPGYFT